MSSPPTRPAGCLSASECYVFKGLKPYHPSTPVPICRIPLLPCRANSQVPPPTSSVAEDLCRESGAEHTPNGNAALLSQMPNAGAANGQPICSSFVSGKGCAYGVQCPFQHGMPASIVPLQDGVREAKLPNGAATLPATLFPEPVANFAAPLPSLPRSLPVGFGGTSAPPPPPPMSHLQSTLPVPVPLAVPAPIHHAGMAQHGLTHPQQQHHHSQIQPFPMNLPMPGGYAAPGMQAGIEQRQGPVAVPSSNPMAALFPPGDSLVGPPASGSMVMPLFTTSSGLDAAADRQQPFLGGLQPHPQPGAPPVGWPARPSAVSNSPAGFPGFADFTGGIRPHGGLGGLGKELPDGIDSSLAADSEQELNSAAMIDAEAFLNSIQDAPAAPSKQAAPLGAPGAATYRGYGRPRYNPVAAYNPLTARGPK